MLETDGNTALDVVEVRRLFQAVYLRSELKSHVYATHILFQQ